jgi:hypothetical protein
MLSCDARDELETSCINAVSNNNLYSLISVLPENRFLVCKQRQLSMLLNCSGDWLLLLTRYFLQVSRGVCFIRDTYFSISIVSCNKRVRNCLVCLFLMLSDLYYVVSAC